MNSASFRPKSSKGKLCTATSNNNYTRTHTYDTLGRPSTTTSTQGAAYTFTTIYDTNTGCPATRTYPVSNEQRQGASLVSRPINIDTTMPRIAAMLCRRARRVHDPAARGFAPGDDFDIVQCIETNGSRH